MQSRVVRRLVIKLVFAVSSAGVVFALMTEVPALTLAAWRLQLTSVFLGVGAAVQWRSMASDVRALTLRKSGLLALSGSALAVHFGSWVWSMEHTSLTHSLLFVSATPLLLALGTWLLRMPISRGELLGTLVGLVGAVLLATAAARTDRQVTVAGDLAALCASLAIIVYLLVGRSLRQWMPLFVYAFPVTALAAVELTTAGAALEGARFAAAGAHGVFGWAASPHYLPLVLYLAVGPGIVGHTGFNSLLRYLPPLVISLACNLEPLIGSLLGWAAGVASTPGPWTYCGGALIMGSTALVSVASSRREKAEAAREAVRLALERALAQPLQPSEARGHGEDDEWVEVGGERAAQEDSATALHLLKPGPGGG
eukprot:scaffold15.g4332.t1